MSKLSFHVGNLSSRGAKGEKKYQAKQKALRKAKALEARSKKAGFYVHGHKNLGDVYED